jgi:hypothetical protein
MKELEISPNFTIEDIHKIREYNEEKRMTIGDEAFWAEVEINSLRMQEKIKEVREKRIAKESISMSKAVSIPTNNLTETNVYHNGELAGITRARCTY